MEPDDFFSLVDANDDPNTLELTIPGEWAQGRTAFGGLTAALLYRLLHDQVASDRSLRSISINFVGPINTDVPLSFSTQLLRQGKNATQIAGNILQDGNVCLSAVCCFATDRDSGIHIEAAPSALPTPPEPAKSRGPFSGAPAFTQYIDLQITEGSAPFSGSDSADFKGWMRLSKPPIALTEAHILLLIDTWPPTVLQMFDRPGPASTMSWNVELVHPHKPLAADAWLAYEATTVQAYAGYAHTEAKVLNTDGELVAISRQLVAVFDR